MLVVVVGSVIDGAWEAMGSCILVFENCWAVTFSYHFPSLGQDFATAF